MPALWQERTLVKTWAMRGTLHLFPADELGLWLGGLSHPPLPALPHARLVAPRVRARRGESWTQILAGVAASLDGRELHPGRARGGGGGARGLAGAGGEGGRQLGSVIKPAATIEAI